MNSSSSNTLAQDEVFRSRARYWPINMLASALITLCVAWGFKTKSFDTQLLVWLLLLWLMFAAQAGLCVKLDRLPKTLPIPVWWWHATHVLTVFVGSLWSSLPWWLAGRDANTQLLAGFVSLMIVLGAAGASNSAGLLMAFVIPAIFLIPSALAVYGSLPIAGIIALLLLLILKHGLAMQRIMVEFIQARQRADALSDALRVEQARAENAAREQAVLMERNRLMHDIHDGLGSTLVTTLVAVQHGSMPQSKLVEVLHSCIEDLRLVIDSLEPLSHDLELLLATIRHRLDQKLYNAGIALRWQISDLPKLTWMESPQALQVMRIFQEVLTNILKHARASDVRIHTHHDSDHAIIVIEDNGIGFDTQQNYSGRGLKHLATRSQLLGVDLIIHSVREIGTQVTLRLPKQKPKNVQSH